MTFDLFLNFYHAFAASSYAKWSREGKSGMRSGLPVLDEHMAVCVTSFPGFHVTTLCLPNVMLPDPCLIPIPLLNSLLLLLIRHLQYGTHFCANFILQVTNAQRPGNNTNLVHSLARVSYRRDWDSFPPPAEI